MSPPAAGLDPATAVSAALTDRQRTVIEAGTPRLYRHMAGWTTARIIADLHRSGIYAAEIAGFLSAVPLDLAAHPCAEHAAIAMRRLGRLYTRPVLEEILGRVRHAR